MKSCCKGVHQSETNLSFIKSIDHLTEHHQWRVDRTGFLQSAQQKLKLCHNRHTPPQYEAQLHTSLWHFFGPSTVESIVSKHLMPLFPVRLLFSLPAKSIIVNLPHNLRCGLVCCVLMTFSMSMAWLLLERSFSRVAPVVLKQHQMNSELSLTPSVGYDRPIIKHMTALIVQNNTNFCTCTPETKIVNTTSYVTLPIFRCIGKRFVEVVHTFDLVFGQTRHKHVFILVFTNR